MPRGLQLKRERSKKLLPNRLQLRKRQLRKQLLRQLPKKLLRDRHKRNGLLLSKSGCWLPKWQQRN